MQSTHQLATKKRARTPSDRPASDPGRPLPTPDEDSDNRLPSPPDPVRETCSQPEGQSKPPWSPREPHQRTAGWETSQPMVRSSRNTHAENDPTVSFYHPAQPESARRRERETLDSPTPVEESNSSPGSVLQDDPASRQHRQTGTTPAEMPCSTMESNDETPRTNLRVQPDGAPASPTVPREWPQPTEDEGNQGASTSQCLSTDPKKRRKPSSVQPTRKAKTRRTTVGASRKPLRRDGDISDIDWLRRWKEMNPHAPPDTPPPDERPTARSDQQARMSPCLPTNQGNVKEPSSNAPPRPANRGQVLADRSPNSDAMADGDAVGKRFLEAISQPRANQALQSEKPLEMPRLIPSKPLFSSFIQTPLRQETSAYPTQTPPQSQRRETAGTATSEALLRHATESETPWGATSTAPVPDQERPRAESHRPTPPSPTPSLSPTISLDLTASRNPTPSPNPPQRYRLVQEIVLPPELEVMTAAAAEGDAAAGRMLFAIDVLLDKTIWGHFHLPGGSQSSEPYPLKANFTMSSYWPSSFMGPYRVRNGELIPLDKELTRTSSMINVQAPTHADWDSAVELPAYIRQPREGYDVFMVRHNEIGVTVVYRKQGRDYKRFTYPPDHQVPLGYFIIESGKACHLRNTKKFYRPRDNEVGFSDNVTEPATDGGFGNTNPGTGARQVEIDIPRNGREQGPVRVTITA